MIKWLMSFKLPANYFKIDGSVKAEPSSQGTQVLRLDENAVLIDTQLQGHPMLAAMMVCLVAGIFFSCFFLKFTFTHLLSPKEAMGWQFDLAIWALLVPSLLYLFVICCALFYLLVILPSPSVILLDRKARKIYGSFRGNRVEMDWNRVKPAITRGMMVNRGGAITLYHLGLVQFAEGQEPSHKTVECGIQLIAGHVGMVPCVALWEFIRHYMDEAPESLPQTEVLSSKRDWTYYWLERGPYGGYDFEKPVMTTLRESSGVPAFGLWHAVDIFFMAPGMFFSLYDTWLRPQTRLKPEWIPAPPSSPNPYAITVPDNSDRPLREKAAKIVIAWVVTLMVSGCAFWWWLISALVSA